MREGTGTERDRGRIARAALALAAVLLATGCYSVQDSQRFFREAAERDPALELLHRTALYNVYYDHALKRCVLHSSHTWGERGGGGGGTGLGVAVFACDPVRIQARVHSLRFRVEDLRDPGKTPRPRPPAQAPPATPTAPAPAAPAESGEER
jgi:hypothetical protein